ncbi:LPXTG cell wall anchor domain-containing protein [Bacillus thuringiensis]|nr:LPXTG cell wall anchor domain-containing protein [Bacillus thuringiensis]
MKKNLVIFSMLMIMVSIFVPAHINTVFAAEEKVYQSNSDISFYGEYEYPSPEKPDGSQVTETYPSTLPVTGGKSNNLYYVEGMTLMLFSLFLLIRARKQSKEEI